MDETLPALAFALLIGAQFLAAIVVTSNRKAIYADPNQPTEDPAPRADASDGSMTEGGKSAAAA
jgi:hypothetical protein